MKILKSTTMDNVITLFERQSIPYQDLGLTANDPLLEILDRLNQNSGKELIRFERKGLRATQGNRRRVGKVELLGRYLELPDCNAAQRIFLCPG